MIKSLYLIFLLTFQIGISLAQNPGFEWVHAHGGPGTDHGRAITTDNQNNVYISGTFIDTIDFDPGSGVTNLYSPSENAFIQKLDASGNLVWVKSFPEGIATVLTIAIDPSGNIILGGSFSSNMTFETINGDDTTLIPNNASNVFVLKMNAAGDFIWGRSFGGSGIGTVDLINEVRTDDQGNIYSIGHFFGASDFDPGPGTETLGSAGGSMDIFIHKLSASGNFGWAKKIGAGATDDGVSLDIYGNTIMLTGSFQMNVDFDPATGSNVILNAQNTDMYLVSFSTNGSFNWVKSFGSAAVDKGVKVRFDPNGKLYLTGSFDAEIDLDPGAAVNNFEANEGTNFFILKLNETSDFLWARTFTGTDYKYSSAMAVHPTNGVVVAGEFKGTTDFDCGTGTNNLYAMGETDVFIVYLDQNGNYRWAGSFGNALNNYEQACDMSLDSQGYIYTIGSFSGEVDFDCGPGPTGTFPPFMGSWDIYLHKLNSNVLSVNEKMLNDFKLYPNPASSMLNISAETLDHCDAIVYNSLGTIVLEKALSNTDKQLDIQTLSTGSYIIQLKNESGSRHQTFIKTD